jgi:uncharacterized protein (DUF433 family)
VTPRRIIRDEGTLYGRWHFQGTAIPVAAIRADAAARINAFEDTYRVAGLTDEEIELALEFDFPDVRKTELHAQYVVATLECSCGEVRHLTLSGFNEGEVACVCGRHWRACLMLEPGDITAAGLVSADPSERPAASS